MLAGLNNIQVASPASYINDVEDVHWKQEKNKEKNDNQTC